MAPHEAPAAAPAASGSYPLDEARCRAVLRDIGWGVLAAVEGETLPDVHPYSVPVAYAFDGDAIFVATRAGRKLRALEPSLLVVGHGGPVSNPTAAMDKAIKSAGG